MPEKILYTAEALSTGDGRSGHVTTADHRLDFDLAPPKEMGGTGEGTNPEELFASGFSACFHSALRVVGRRAKADVDGSTVTGRVSIGPDGPGYGLAVELLIHLPNVPADTAKDLAAAAHEVCPYSRATRGNIAVDLRIV